MPDTKIAFLCSPTAYVAFQHHKHLEGAYCFEYDQRFESAFRQNFVHYDLHQPEKLPESLLGVVDIAGGFFELDLSCLGSKLTVKQWWTLPF
jgi:hypothetical protein